MAGWVGKLGRRRFRRWFLVPVRLCGVDRAGEPLAEAVGVPAAEFGKEIGRYEDLALGECRPIVGV